MWRMMLGVIVLAGVAGACSGAELSVQDNYLQRIDEHNAATFTVTYEWRYESATLGAVSDIRTWYQSGDAQRVDYTLDGEELVSLWTGEHAYECSTYPNRLSGKPGCFLDLAPNVLDVSPVQSHWTAMNQPERYEITQLEDRDISGERTHCFMGKAKAAREPDVKLCLTDDGLILYTANHEVGSIWGALEVTREVPEGTFEPPMEVTGEHPSCSMLDC